MYRTNVNEMDTAVLKRSSTFKQATSIQNQGRTVESVIAEHKLNVVKEYTLEGVTGSIPGNRSDIDDVIELKQKLKVKRLLLLVPDHTRFTRAGAGHGGHLLYQLRANSVLVYFVAEDLLIENDLTLQLALMLLSAAHQTAKSIARSSTIGTDSSYLAGKSPHSRVPPFGLDRMYLVDGKPIHILHNLSDGTQEMLDPATREFVRRFAQNPQKGIPAHYIKQKNETVALCPGAPADLAKLFILFEMKYVLRMKYRRIALELNEAGITAPLGGGWTAATVMGILLNPIYVGQSIRYRRTKSVYVTGGSENGEPEPSEVTPEELDKNPKVKVRRRDRRKWREREAAQFKDFLPVHLRDAAREAVNDHLDAIADGQPLKVINRDPHVDSLYLLKNLIHCKKSGQPMTGRLSGKKGRTVRKYAIGKGAHIPREGVCTKRVPAEPIENAVMGLVRQVILNRPRMIEAMKAVVARSKQEIDTEPNDRDTIDREIKKLKKRIAILSDQIDDDADESGDDPIVRKIESIHQEIKRFNALARRSKATPRSPQDLQITIERLADGLVDFGRKIDPTESTLTRAVIDLLVNRIEVDRDTKEFEITLAVPSWLAHVLNQGLPAGLESMTGCKPLIETHPENREILGIFQCDASGKPLCYACKRGQAA